MLRSAVVRGVRASEQALYRSARTQWQPQRVALPLRRAFADSKLPDKTVLPGSQSDDVAGVPQPPIVNAPAPNEISPSQIPPEPPTPAEAKAAVAANPSPKTVSSSTGSTGNLPPTGTGTASTGPAAAAPKRPRRRFRRFLTSLVLLSVLGYAGGVYYSLVSDNFHDFFTEYVPFGEDAVAYFEDREFRKRFPQQKYESKNWPQMRGENKVTIGKSSGLSAKVAEEGKAPGSDLGSKGRHSSATGDNTAKPQPAAAQQTPESSTRQESVKAVEAAKKGSGVPKEAHTEPSSNAITPAPAAAAGSSAPLVDHINVSNASEPVVQELVKMVNNIITAVNASPEASKFSSTLTNTKGDMDRILGAIATMKETTEHDAQTKIQNAHTEFDTAAKELVRRLEQEMREQEAKWREEYESERERLSASYQQKLSAELDAARRVAEEKSKNSLLEQEISLQKRFTDSVKAKIEEERNGRLSKLDELSSSVSELNDLTSQWNEVVDANLRTQHLHVALGAVRNAVLNSEHPTPFTNELVALKEVSGNNDIVNAAIASINPAAYQRGIPTPAHLIDRFRRVASEVRKASLLPEDAGIASHAASAVLSRMMFTKKAERGLPEGDDVEATLARTEVLLEEGDLETAAREMNGLKGWAGVLSRDWIAETRRVLEVRQAVDVIATEARLQSLLVK